MTSLGGSWAMSENYSHLLIPTSASYCPKSAQVAQFVGGIISLGAIPKGSSIRVRELVKNLVRRTHEGKNPFTGKVIKLTEPSRRPGTVHELDTAADIGAVASLYDEYDVEVSGYGRPRLPPLKLDFRKAYHLAISCHIRSTPVSTSDLHEDSLDKRKATPFWEDCSENVRMGLYTDPVTMETIKVPNAGCAHFFVMFAPGKFLFPKIEREN